MQAGRELDALVAEKVMGYTLDYEFAEQMGAPAVPALRDQYDEWGVLPAYSTDIAAAWNIVEAFARRGFRFHVHANPGHYSARVITEANPHDWHHAPNASMAICLAALRAVGVDNA